MKTLIKNGLVVGPASTQQADILIDNGKIERIEKNISAQDIKVIDAAGKLVFPGFIDPHTHMEMTVGSAEDPVPTADNFTSGTLAAVCGGTTTILDFAGQDKGMTLAETLDKWHAMADGKSSCNYGFHVSISDWNAHTKAEMANMAEAGVSSYKLYMAYDNIMVNDAEMYEIMKAAAKNGAIVSAHCENGLLVDELIEAQKSAGNLGTAAHPLSRPDYAEAEAVDRFLTIAESLGVPAYVVHLSTKRGLEVIRAARERGQSVYIESCPQYFYLDDSLYSLPDFEGAKYVFAPPARKQTDITALTGALKSAEIDTIGSDQCSFNFKGDKERGREDFSKIPNGLPGAELRPALLYTKAAEAGLSPNAFAELASTNAAKIYGMYPEKGVLLPGSDADIVIWDPNKHSIVHNSSLHHQVDYSPYEGYELVGAADAVLISGVLAAENGEPVNTGLGKYVSRKPVL